jgi:hypothetical protein
MKNAIFVCLKADQYANAFSVYLSAQFVFHQLIWLMPFQASLFNLVQELQLCVVHRFPHISV